MRMRPILLIAAGAVLCLLAGLTILVVTEARHLLARRRGAVTAGTRSGPEVGAAAA